VLALVKALVRVQNLCCNDVIINSGDQQIVICLLNAHNGNMLAYVMG